MRLEEWYRMTERQEERELRRKLKRRKWLDALATVVAVPIFVAVVALLILLAAAAEAPEALWYDFPRGEAGEWMEARI